MDVVKVYLMDGSSKTFLQTEGLTAADLYAKLVTKLDLTDDASRYFALFECQGPKSRKMAGDEEMATIVSGWGDGDGGGAGAGEGKAGGSGQPIDAGNRIEVRKWNFNRPREANTADPVAVHLFWVQAVYDITNGNFVAEHHVLLSLAGLQMQALFGDHNDERHVRGFLAGKLGEYLPADMLETRRPIEWEDAILAEHTKCVGVSEDDAKTAYLEQARAVPFYGTVWFQPCKCREWDGDVILGVGPEGIHVFKSPSREHLVSYVHVKVRRWLADSAKFSFEVGRTDVYQFAFDTTEGLFIDECMRMCVDEILAAKRLMQQMQAAERERLEQEAEENGQGGSSDGDSDAGGAGVGGGEPTPTATPTPTPTATATATTTAPTTAPTTTSEPEEVATPANTTPAESAPAPTPTPTPAETVEAEQPANETTAAEGSGDGEVEVEGEGEGEGESAAAPLDTPSAAVESAAPTVQAAA